MANQKENEQDKKKRTPISEQAREKKDSGRPGGGAGRREKVEGSGVYPASGPLPPDNAPYKSEGEFGQGKRGAAGYNDSGDSELLTYEGTPDLGGEPQGATPAQPSSGQKQGSSSGNREGGPELDPDRELPSGEDAHDRRANARKKSQ